MLNAQNTDNIITGVNTVFLLLVIFAITLTIIISKGRKVKVKKKK
jgi:biopolymer transport protein ExbD